MLSFWVFSKETWRTTEAGISLWTLLRNRKRGVAAKGQVTTTDINELVRLGYVSVEGLRYEDFLPVSAAGIFASNLSQYGTQSTAAEKPNYSQSMLEHILDRKIVDANETYARLQAESLITVYSQLGLDHKPAIN